METRTPGNEPMPRRRFLDFLIGGTGVLTVLTFLGGVLSYMWPTKKAGSGANEPVEVGPETDLPVGQGKVVQFRESTALVIHVADGLVAFSAVCPHLGCIVKWNAEKKEIECPCHGAIFDIKGNVVSGPPPKPLPPIKVGVRNGKIFLGA